MVIVIYFFLVSLNVFNGDIANVQKSFSHKAESSQIGKLFAEFREEEYPGRLASSSVKSMKLHKFQSLLSTSNKFETESQ